MTGMVIDGWDGTRWDKVKVGVSVPSAAPYNTSPQLPVPTPAIYGATIQAVHPTVVDFRLHGKDTWNGHRFWGSWTPYPFTTEDYENPCIYVSADGIVWEEPAGFTNPLKLNPYDSTTHHSDPDFAYDPDTDTLWLMFRESGLAQQDPQHFLAYSTTDGITWTRSDVPPVWGVAHAAQVSPVLLRAKRGDWWLWSVSGSSLVYRNGGEPLGPFSRHRTCTITNPPASGSIWHFGVENAPDGHGFHGIFQYSGSFKVPDSGWATYPASSADGITWTLGAEVLSARQDEWDQELYRPCMQLHGGRTKYRVWYSARRHEATYTTWHIGYTEIPLTEWPAIP